MTERPHIVGGVYLSIPTSNHNFYNMDASCSVVFICLFLHQTTTRMIFAFHFGQVFICLFLHQTTTSTHLRNALHLVFICLFLHQTTTSMLLQMLQTGCLSVYSYIKPQHVFLGIKNIHRCLSVYSYIKPQPRYYFRLYNNELRIILCLRSGS